MHLNVLKLNIVMCIVLINIIVTNTCIKCTLNTNIHTTHDIKIYNEKRNKNGICSYLLNRLLLGKGWFSLPTTTEVDLFPLQFPRTEALQTEPMTLRACVF